MFNRASESGQHVTEEIASLVKAMVHRGDIKHDVAAFFGLNPGRVADVMKGRLFPSTRPATEVNLPPPGPYLEAMRTWVDQRSSGERPLR
jgi:hypothetical protein